MMTIHSGFQITQRNIPVLYMYPSLQFFQKLYARQALHPQRPNSLCTTLCPMVPCQWSIHHPSCFLSFPCYEFLVLVNKPISVGTFSRRAAVEVSIISLCDYLATCCSSRHLTIFHIFQQFSVLPSSGPSLNKKLSFGKPWTLWMRVRMKQFNLCFQWMNHLRTTGVLRDRSNAMKTQHSTCPHQRDASHCCKHLCWQGTRHAWDCQATSRVENLIYSYPCTYIQMSVKRRVYRAPQCKASHSLQLMRGWLL